MINISSLAKIRLRRSRISLHSRVWARLVLSSVFLILLTYLIGVQSTAFTGFPKGYDFFDHASVVKIARDNFPHIFWNPYWDFGTVFFPRNYPPLYHFLLAGLSGIGPHFAPEVSGASRGKEIGELMVWVAALNIIVTALAIFGIIYLLAKKILPALIGALFYLSSSAIWSHLLIYGLYARVFAQMTLSLAILALVFWFRRVEIQGQSSIRHAEFSSASFGILKPFGLAQGGQVQDDRNAGEETERSDLDRRSAELAGQTSKRSYYLVVFSFAAVFLSHFLTSILLVLAFFTFLILLFPQGRNRLRLTVKVFFPVAGLASFFYLPLFFWEFQKGNFLGVFTSKAEVPLSVGELFQQSSSGLPFLSLPLFFFLALLVWLTREKTKEKEPHIIRHAEFNSASDGILKPFGLAQGGQVQDDNQAQGLERIFWGTGLLVLPLLLYVLGFWGRYFAGISPSQFLIPVVFFLSIFCSLGFSLLSSFKILSQRTLTVVVVGFLALALSQIPHLKKGVIDQSRPWPEVAFKTIDKERLFRFAHRNEVLGGAFNFYSPTLQSRGYWAPGVLFPSFNLWFEEAVFGKNDNPRQTAFLLDWFGVKGLYIGRLTKDGKTFSLEPKMTQNPEIFAKAGDYEWVYKNASPLLLATNAPVVLVKAGDEEYRKILEGLAKEGVGSGAVIPLRVGETLRQDFDDELSRIAQGKGEIREIREIGGKDLPRVSSWEKMGKVLASLRGPTSYEVGPRQREGGGQNPKFVHSQRREIEIERKFSGVLLKESYFRNWGAWLEKTEDGRRKTEELKIYQAGPGMMFVFLPVDYSTPAKIVFEYRQSLIEKIGLLISFVTIILIVLSRWRKNLRKKLTEKLKIK